MGWSQEISLCFQLQNVSISINRKVDVDQTCIINVSLDERHPIIVTYTPKGGVGSSQEIGLCF